MSTTVAREFHLGDILSITTGRLVSPRHIDGVYDILNWMTGDNLMTHQLPRACGECEGPLRAQHPDLAEITVPDELDSEAKVLEWLGTITSRYSEKRCPLPRSPQRTTPASTQSPNCAQCGQITGG